jgi:hypothetical protein
MQEDVPDKRHASLAGYPDQTLAERLNLSSENVSLLTF